MIQKHDKFRIQNSLRDQSHPQPTKQDEDRRENDGGHALTNTGFEIRALSETSTYQRKSFQINQLSFTAMADVVNNSTNDRDGGKHKSSNKKGGGGFQSMGLSEEIYRGIVKMGFRVSRLCI